MARMDAGDDFQSEAMGGELAANHGFTGTSTGTTATTLTQTGATWTTDQWAGHIVTTGATYGVVLSNTATVLTIDKWYAPADPGGAAAATPATGVHVINGQANFPGRWMAVTENSTAPVVTDTTLAGELTGSGFARAFATWAHTAASNTYTLTNTYTSSDGTTRTIAKMGLFAAQNGGRMVFQTLVSPTATLVSGDQLTITDTVTI